MTSPRHLCHRHDGRRTGRRYTPRRGPSRSPYESKGRAPIEALGIWLTLEEAAVLVALLELLPDAHESPELTELRDRWQQRIGNRMSEAMTGLSPDGFDAGRAAGD